MTAIDRFLRYVTYDTQSDEHSDAIPSTAKQKVLGAALAEELAQMGLHNAHMDEYGYVYAWLPATAGCEGIPCVGLIAHMDTSPDEEVGQGADHFDVEGFGAAVAYTVDGGELGELEYENFNAANAGVYFHGVNIHPGSAKNKMKNAILIALEFAGMLPPAETPAHTEGYEGFYHLHDMKGSETGAELHYILRDHDRARFEARKEYLGRAADYLNAKYGAGTVELVLKDSYYNMREQIEPHMYLILRARAAMEAAGVTPVEVPIRGGTDGARLSYMGLPCPNLCTGGVNFHGVHEYIPAQALTKMTEVLVNLLTRQ